MIWNTDHRVQNYLQAYQQLSSTRIVPTTVYHELERAAKLSKLGTPCPYHKRVPFINRRGSFTLRNQILLVMTNNFICFQSSTFLVASCHLNMDPNFNLTAIEPPRPFIRRPLYCLNEDITETLESHIADDELNLPKNTRPSYTSAIKIWVVSYTLNHYLHRINSNIDDKCPSCSQSRTTSSPHFFDCPTNLTTLVVEDLRTRPKEVPIFLGFETRRK